nr:glycoside hydrolase family 6 protein [Citreicoccus inhibens]
MGPQLGALGESERWGCARGQHQSSIASKPGAKWFGNWSGDIASAVSSYVGAADTLPLLVAYNVPGRDCGGQSPGGAGSAAAYPAWIAAFASGIGNRPAVVIIEPDAAAQVDCLPSDAERALRHRAVPRPRAQHVGLPGWRQRAVERRGHHGAAAGVSGCAQHPRLRGGRVRRLHHRRFDDARGGGQCVAQHALRLHAAVRGGHQPQRQWPR